MTDLTDGVAMYREDVALLAAAMAELGYNKALTPRQQANFMQWSESTRRAVANYSDGVELFRLDLKQVHP